MFKYIAMLLLVGCAAPSTNHNTGVTDTGVTDTGVTDTGVTDTGDTDTGVTDTGLYLDADNDGFTPDEGDCDDEQPAINPLATDIVGDGIDQNCDGLDGYDADGDGFADLASGGDDCDDTDDTVFPGAVEVWYDGKPQDCADFNSIGNWAGDGDQDGDGSDAEIVGGLDCDDSNAAISPFVLEDNTNGIDDNCNGLIDQFGLTITWNPNVDPTFTATLTDVYPTPDIGYLGMILWPQVGTHFQQVPMAFDTTTATATASLNRPETLFENDYATLYYTLYVNGTTYCWGAAPNQFFVDDGWFLKCTFEDPTAL